MVFAALRIMLNRHINLKLGVLILFNFVNCEVFSSIEDVAGLMLAHENVISNLKDYVVREEIRMRALKR